MISPTPGSTLAGSTVTFTWTGVAGASQYALWFGSTPGAYDLGYTYQTGTSYTALLPATGATLYVRLWYMAGGVWLHAPDYTYTEATFRMLTPTPGSTLPGTSIQFTWTPLVGASQYAIWFGSTLGTYNLGYSYQAGTSYTATLPPATGATLYVRLWYQVIAGGPWQQISYTYVH